MKSMFITCPFFCVFLQAQVFNSEFVVQRGSRATIWPLKNFIMSKPELVAQGKTGLVVWKWNVPLTLLRWLLTTSFLMYMQMRRNGMPK